jgi:hypothetical protein
MADNSDEIVIKDDDIVKAYSNIASYDPDTGAGDDGAAGLTVLNYWRTNGIAGHKIYAYAAIDPKNIKEVKAVIYIFGGVYAGFNLPASAKTQDILRVSGDGKTGDNAPGSWGGHAICAIGYDNDYIYTISWGIIKKCTWQFWTTYCIEAFAIISEEFINSGKTPNGFDMTALKAHLKAVTAAANTSALGTKHADAGMILSIWDKYGKNLPSVFRRTIYRVPTVDELKEINSYPFTPSELLQGLTYTIVGRSIKSDERKQLIKEALVRLIKMYPGKTTYIEAFKQFVPGVPAL